MTTSPLSAPTLAALAAAGLDPDAVADLARRTVAEDLAGGVDVTSVATVPGGQVGTAAFVPRQPGVVAGIAVAMACFDVVATDDLTWDVVRSDGPAAAGETVLQATGLVRTLLTAERSALNLLCHLSGVATLTARWVEAVEGTGARIRDTRKTTPGLRALEKAAVVVGGGVNHRMSLVRRGAGEGQPRRRRRGRHAGVRGRARATARTSRSRSSATPSSRWPRSSRPAPTWCCSTTWTSTPCARPSRSAGRAACAPRRPAGLTLDRARVVAETGVDFLSVGGLTHSAPVLDLGLDLLFATGPLMLLTVDVGNTNIVLGLFDGDAPVRVLPPAHRRPRHRGRARPALPRAARQPPRAGRRRRLLHRAAGARPAAADVRPLLRRRPHRRGRARG